MDSGIVLGLTLELVFRWNTAKVRLIFLRERHLFDQIEEAGEEDLGMGDIERLVIEWRSLLDLISHSQKLESSRWQKITGGCQESDGTKSVWRSSLYCPRFQFGNAGAFRAH